MVTRSPGLKGGMPLYGHPAHLNASPSEHCQRHTHETGGESGRERFRKERRGGGGEGSMRETKRKRERGVRERMSGMSETRKINRYTHEIRPYTHEIRTAGAGP